MLSLNLALADNKLNGSIPASLGGMVSLTSLDLSQNMLTGVIPKSLESLLYLQSINFSYNRLQGEIPDGGPFKNFTAQSFMHNEALCGNSRMHVPQCVKQVKKTSMTKKVLIKCIVPIVVSSILVVALIILLKQKKRKSNESNLERGLSSFRVARRISYYELVQATNGFSESNLLGRGGFGSVYQGKLPDGEMVAVKVIDLQSEEKSRSFDAECNAMRNLRHRNLVKIISSCSNLDFKSLVMEFMSNGSVDKWLYSNNHCLNFLQRLNIMIDVASALEYLHHGSSIPVIHCDLKPTNVLLDENMVAHVSDFGIAKLMDEGQSKTHTQTLATIGYPAPGNGQGVETGRLVIPILVLSNEAESYLSQKFANRSEGGQRGGLPFLDDPWLEEGVSLRDRFHRLAGLFTDQGVPVEEMCRRGWDMGGREWSWRRPLFVWEEELLAGF
ncbi:hypothetical protein TSUD_129560 [Trifolium subterraneum]|uniref:non-specific serine/threonine protein kinase n=1 Tax=Trifolium subterraneum TaxID=3900 RepID=A0A2Z6P832_TRISU|nr:hypothetical protein TSUD_129560 [Trifolium subterraneum]